MELGHEKRKEKSHSKLNFSRGLFTENVKLDA